MSKMKPKGLKTKKKREDLDSFIEAELNNLQKTGGTKPSLGVKKTTKVKKTNLIKPSLISKSKKERPPLEEPVNVPAEPIPEMKPK